MIRTPPQHNTKNPPGQIVHPVNLEKPLQGHIKDFQAHETEQLRARVQELEKELQLYKDSLNYWKAVAIQEGWKGDN